MPVSLEDVRQTARLARIGLTDATAVQYAEEPSAILGDVDRLQAVDASAAGAGPVFADGLPPDRDLARTDEAAREQIIQGFPDRLGDLLRVPSVFPGRAKPVSS